MSYLGRKGALAPVTSADIPDSSISTAKLLDSSVTSAKIGVDVIVAEDIANNAVTVAELADNAVTTAKINADAVTTAKIAADAVGTTELANDIAISTSGAITTTGAFTSVGIDDNASGATAITIDSSENVTFEKNVTVGDGAAGETIFKVLGGEAGNAEINIFPDQADDNADKWKIVADTSGDFGISTKSSGSYVEVLTILSSGKVGIGTTAPDAVRLEVKSSGGSSEEAFVVKDVNNNKVFIQTGGGGAKFAYGPLTLGNSGTWAAGSNVLLVEASGQINISRSGTGSNNMIGFYNGNGGIGTITTSGSGTAFNTSSDYRLKENVVSMSGSIDRLKTLKPSRFNFIADADTTLDGFLAHEAQVVVPEAVTGEKDAVTEVILYIEGDELPEGKSIGDVKTASVPDMQGIDQSKLVPLLVGALQEAIARIETLESA